MNKQQLAAKLWASANDLRGKMDASEYKNYILGFLFYKFLSEHEVGYLAKEYEMTLDDLDDENIDTLKSDLGYYIAKGDLYSTWIANIKGGNWRISNVTDALSHFRQNLDPHQKEDFEGIFDDVNLTSEKLGSNASEKESAVRKLLVLLDDINISSNTDYDTFGFIYEYLIAQFAMSSGKKAGEFYTPHQVSQIMASIVANEIRGKTNPMVYDPTAGSGSLLLTLGSAISPKQRNQIKYYGQENNSTTYNIARMNLLMRGVSPANMVLRNADTLKEDWPNGIISGKDDPLFVDTVVANPPYSAKWEASENQLKDPRYRDYGVAPATKADYAFLLHSLYHLKPDGVMAIVLPHGVLFRGNEEEKIRTKLLQRGQIDAVIGLPAGIFTNTGIPTIIVILRKQSKHNNVLFIDASNGYRKEKNTNVLREQDIKKILDTYITRQNVDGYAHLANLDEIRANGFNLNIPRYVTPIGNDDNHSIEAHLKGGIPLEDMARFAPFWQKFPNISPKLWQEIRPNFVKLSVKTDQIFDIINQDHDYGHYINDLGQQINAWQHDFAHALTADKPLGEDDFTLAFENAENRLFELFRLSEFSDPYHAYQSLIDVWHSTILPDLLILSDETGADDDEELANLIDENGFYKARRLVPNMVIKGKNEVQDGVKGELLSKQTIGYAFFADEIGEIDRLKQSLDEIEERQAERLANIADTALTDYLNDKEKLDEKSYKSIEKDLKTMRNDDENFELLSESLADFQAAKTLKAQLKTKEPALNSRIEAKYQELDLEEIKRLLIQKWFGELANNLSDVGQSYAKTVANQLKVLDERYADTLEDIRRQRQQAENAFWAMANQLIGGV